MDRTLDLNVVMAAALEFGPDWLRPVRALAGERLPGRDDSYLDEIAEAVERCRSSIEVHVYDRYKASRAASTEAWPHASGEAASEWIAETYPWMTAENRSLAISRAVYYAYKDLG